MRHIGVFIMVAAVAVLAGPVAADNPQLQASVGPGFTISLKDASGAKVTHLDPGTYRPGRQQVDGSHRSR